MQHNSSANARSSLAREGQGTEARWLFLITNNELPHLPQRCQIHAVVNKIFLVDERFARLGLGPR